MKIEVKNFLDGGKGVKNMPKVKKSGQKSQKFPVYGFALRKTNLIAAVLCLKTGVWYGTAIGYVIFWFDFLFPGRGVKRVKKLNKIAHFWKITVIISYKLW